MSSTELVSLCFGDLMHDFSSLLLKVSLRFASGIEGETTGSFCNVLDDGLVVSEEGNISGLFASCAMAMKL